MPQQSDKTLVVMADAGGAVLYLHARPGAALTMHTALDAGSSVHQHTHELGQDRPPRVYQSVGSAHHAQEPRVDLHRKAKTDFAAELARQIDEAMEAEGCASLILVAPARLIGDLRHELGDAARTRIRGEVVKDLRRRPLAQLVETLRQEVGLRVQD